MLITAGFDTVASKPQLVERLVKMLTDQKGMSLGCRVDLYEHGLQTASRCYRHRKQQADERPPADGQSLVAETGIRAEDDELCTVALLHDVGECLSPINHGEVAASLLRPYISPRNWWILAHHEIFQVRAGGSRMI